MSGFDLRQAQVSRRPSLSTPTLGSRLLETQSPPNDLGAILPCRAFRFCKFRRRGRLFVLQYGHAAPVFAGRLGFEFRKPPFIKIKNSCETFRAVHRSPP